MISDEITQLIAGLAEVKAEVKGLKEADARTRQNLQRLYSKIDRLTSAVVLTLGALVANLALQLWRG